MGREQAKARPMTPEAIKDAKKRALFQRLSWSGLLASLEAEMGPIRIGAGESISWDGKPWIYSIAFWQDDEHQKPDEVDVMLRRYYSPKRFNRILIKYDNEGMVTINGGQQRSLYNEEKLNPVVAEKLEKNIRLARIPKHS